MPSDGIRALISTLIGIRQLNLQEDANALDKKRLDLQATAQTDALRTAASGRASEFQRLIAPISDPEIRRKAVASYQVSLNGNPNPGLFELLAAGTPQDTGAQSSEIRSGVLAGKEGTPGPGGTRAGLIEQVASGRTPEGASREQTYLGLTPEERQQQVGIAGGTRLSEAQKQGFVLNYDQLAQSDKQFLANIDLQFKEMLARAQGGKGGIEDLVEGLRKTIADSKTTGITVQGRALTNALINHYNQQLFNLGINLGIQPLKETDETTDLTLPQRIDRWRASP